MQYSIYEENIERLDKKMLRIQNRCKRFGCNFKYEKVGEEYKEYKDPETKSTSYLKYIIVEAEGVAVINDWKFIATIEHTPNGNILRTVCDTEIPERFYTCQPYCEHCKSKRHRKDTYLVQNTQTGEFKQVGRNCLNDYTHGLNADAIALYMSAFDYIIEGSSTSGEYSHYIRYYPTKDILRYAYETVKHFGYHKSEDEDGMPNPNSTKLKVLQYYDIDTGHANNLPRKILKDRQSEMSRVGFNALSEDAIQLVKDALSWIEEQDESNSYMHNLKTVCSLDYQSRRNIGILVSLIPTYLREIDKQIQDQQEKKVSEFVGEVGDRVEFTIDDVVCLSSHDTPWGYSSFYKITDTEGNIYTWSTTVPFMSHYMKMKGTVKAHEEYRGTKQTVLTRCKIIYSEAG